MSAWSKAGSALVRDFPLQSISMLVLSLAAGVFVSTLAATPAFLLYAAAAAILLLLLPFPEIALALYVVVGDVKGDDRIAALLPFDWTIALAAVLAAGMILNLVRGRRIVRMPSPYFLIGLLTVWMAISLSYTPDLGAGVEKLSRFVTVTAVVFIAPFFVLGTSAAMKRFLVAFGCVAFAICVYALLGLGSTSRLVSPSDNTIGLGHVASAVAALLWLAAISCEHRSLRWLLYAFFAIPALALVGSGSRGSVVACVAIIAISAFFFRKRIADVACITAIGLCAFPFLGVPESSLDYLATLVRSGSVGTLLDFRGDLIGYGWQLLQSHPLIGTGIAGFQYSSPNPNVYKWPHNIFLEVACELGLPAVLLVFAFFTAVARESLRQLLSPSSGAPLFAWIAGAWFLLGILNGLNTGDINSDRSTWLFASLVFVVGSYFPSRSPATEDAFHPELLPSTSAP